MSLSHMVRMMRPMLVQAFSFAQVLEVTAHGRYGLAVDATTVHHAWPAEDFPELEWEDWNLISLCSGCHGAMHDRVSGALTDLGLSWRRRVSPPPPPPSLKPPRVPKGGALSDGGEN